MLSMAMDMVRKSIAINLSTRIELARIYAFNMFLLIDIIIKKLSYDYKDIKPIF